MDNKWANQLYYEDVSVGRELNSIAIPLSLHRLVMEAGANRDLAFMHHDKEAGIAAGAKDAFANTFFLLGMFERLLREWVGLKGQIKKIGPMRMQSFNCVGDTVVFKGKVREKSDTDGMVIVALWVDNNGVESVVAEATVIVPKRI